MAHHDRSVPRRRGGGPSSLGRTQLDAEQAESVEELRHGLHAMAESLRAAPDSAGQTAALSSLESTAEPVALAFAQLLGTIRGGEAHDAIEVAQALGELDPRKAVAYEARRSRLRLRSAGAMPSSPAGAPPVSLPRQDAVQPSAPPALTTSGLPRFAAAYVSKTREQGEVRLFIGWQEGQDPNFVRGHGFQLDFWESGVKAFTLTDPMSRTRFEREVRDFLGDVKEENESGLIAVGWVQARTLVQEALDVNTWRGTSPSADFTRYRSQIEARLLAYPTSDDRQSEIEIEERRLASVGDRPYISTKLEPEETVVNWLGAWTFGDFGLTYDLLADDHPIRLEMSRREYIGLRRQWWDQAEPSGLRVTLVREQEKRASALWVPGSALLNGRRKELEAFWSVILREVELGGQLAELPLATIFSAETGRHWYWTGYTVSRDQGDDRWYISRSRDEGAASQTLKIEELNNRIADAHRQVEEITAKEPPEPGSDSAAQALRTITGELTASLHYSDAMAILLPLDESVYRNALTDARTLGNHERAVALIERMRKRFADSVRLRFEQGIEEYLVSEQYGRQGMAEAEASWLERAIQILRAVAAEEPTGEHLQGLGELLARQGHFNQAETYLREAAAADPGRALVYSDLADALMGRITGENLDDQNGANPGEQERIAHDALAALGQASKLDSNIPGLHTRMGAIYEMLHQPEDAIIALEEAIRVDPADADAHYAIGNMLMERKRYENALPHLVTAVQLAPLALQARLSLAACYGMLGQMTQASRELDAIDRIQPGLPQVAELRSYLAEQRKRH